MVEQSIPRLYVREVEAVEAVEAAGKVTAGGEMVQVVLEDLPVDVEESDSMSLTAAKAEAVPLTH